MSTEYDSRGFAIPGTYAISTVHIGGSKADGTPVPFVQSAVCDRCGGWASAVLTASRGSAMTDSLFDARISRRESIVVYACPTHRDEVQHNLTDEYGASSNRYDPDELADKVSRESAATAIEQMGQA